MRFFGSTEADAHRQPALDAVVLVNLGTPAAPTPTAVRRYLAEFLADPRVIETPRWLWWLILHGVILRIRPRRSARAYARIWTDRGSPLLIESQALTAAVQSAIAAAMPGLEVHLAMSYGAPALPAVLDTLRQRGLRRLAVLPLYPQYSGSTTGAVFDAVTRVLQVWRWVPQLRFIDSYCHAPGHIAALADSVRAHWVKHGRAERLLLSFHGIPRRYVLTGDPYYCQCLLTARLLREALQMSADELQVSFQSRVGREVWLQPYTEEMLGQWARTGIKRVQVLCPGFAVDCLETLDEIAVEAAAHFLAAGGAALEYIPCLNAQPAQVAALTALIQQHTGDWIPLNEDPATVAARLARADAIRSAPGWEGVSSP